MFRPDVPSRRVYLAAMKGLVFVSPSFFDGVLVDKLNEGFCSNPSGQDILTTLD
jgi:hypothetical protein